MTDRELLANARTYLKELADAIYVGNLEGHPNEKKDPDARAERKRFEELRQIVLELKGRRLQPKKAKP